MQVNQDYLDGMKWPGEQSPADKAKDPGRTELGQEDFFALMTQQLAYQDPFDPADNSDMIAQMTAFTSADGINQMSEKLSGLSEVMTSSQALQASSLVGQKVLLPSNLSYWDESDTVEGVAVTGEGADNVVIRIENEKGEVVRTMSLDGPQRGNVPISWDGLNEQGEPAPKGQYKVKVSGLVDNQREDLNALVFGRVDSVTLGSANSPTLVNLSGLGGIPLNQVLEIAGNKAA
ncbi:flagellar hook assembly protein FlgD [Oceanisphaera pacifica]|uniref:Basal-body rod modification protein FlgD n=1 Tax=Oceanisphaera pacifica TaxID=2818389 RepID=A0ABS3NHB7_9GAMM|nr:flagellar hook assembly protein FlgD [Oceanisphaera pacifica]MBO1519966.1 flagellar hook assembly protein FlgD [Oceanisphaera pacifica]